MRVTLPVLPVVLSLLAGEKVEGGLDAHQVICTSEHQDLDNREKMLTASAEAGATQSATGTKKESHAAPQVVGSVFTNDLSSITGQTPCPHDAPIFRKAYEGVKGVTKGRATDECQCQEGYVGGYVWEINALHWQTLVSHLPGIDLHKPGEWKGGCSKVECPRNSFGHPNCKCNKGAVGVSGVSVGGVSSPVWNGLLGKFDGECRVVPCPAGTYSPRLPGSNLDGAPDCACNPGTEGEVTWNGLTGRYDSFCRHVPSGRKRRTHSSGKPDNSESGYSEGPSTRAPAHINSEFCRQCEKTFEAAGVLDFTNAKMTPDFLKKAYHLSAKKFHPDKQGDSSAEHKRQAEENFKIAKGCFHHTDQSKQEMDYITCCKSNHAPACRSLKVAVDY